jgi:hypothetical protein
MKKLLISTILLFLQINIFGQLDQNDIRILPNQNNNQVEVSTVISRLYPNSILSMAIKNNPNAVPNLNRNNLYAYSYDGGTTWLGDINLPINHLNGPDPVTTIDADGRGFLTYLMYYNNLPSTVNNPNRYGVSKSSNVNNFSIWNNQVNGCTPQNATYFNDKPWIVADNYRMSPKKTIFMVHGQREVAIMKYLQIEV